MDEIFKCGSVALVGRPNAGKSTLLNTIIGEKLAIVTPKPQTTRSVMAGIVMRPNVQIVFYDTPGIHRPKNELSKYMVHCIQRALDGSDMALFMLDSSQGIEEEEELAVQWLNKYDRPVYLILNKMDIIAYPKLLDLEHKAKKLGKWPQYRIQATSGQGVEELLVEIERILPEQPPLYPDDQLTDKNVRDLAAELIREQCLLQLKKEIPYGVVVVIEKYEEKTPPHPTVITATLYVEKSSHKGILIGIGGRQLKAIGTAARKSIETMIGQTAFLQLWVKVSKNWRKDPQKLKQLGFQ